MICSHWRTMISVCCIAIGDRLVDPVQDAGVGDFLDQVDDVVQTADQPVDVLSVERSDEGRFQLVADVMADLVAGVFGVAQLAGNALALVVVAEELLQQARGGQHVPCVVHEQVEELLLARDQRQTHPDGIL